MAVEWAQVESGSTHDCECRGSPDLTPYEQQIHEYLGETISLTDVEITVILEVIWDWTREEMVEFLWEEIFKVVVSVLSRKLRKSGRRRGTMKGKGELHGTHDAKKHILAIMRDLHSR